MKVLLVEDSDVSRIALQQMLERRGHEVTPCPDAEVALAEFGCQYYPLVLVDLGLPGMDGFEFCRRVRVLPRCRPTVIIAITCRDTIDDVRRVMVAGADDYIVKPVPASILDVRLAIAEWHLRRHSELSQQQDEIYLLKALTALNDAPDLVSMLESALRLGQEAGWAAGQAWTPTADGSILECRCGWYASPQHFGEVHTPSLLLADEADSSLPARAWRTRDLVCSGLDVDLAAGPVDAEGRRLMRQAVAVPVMAGDAVVAVLEFFMRERRAGDERLLTLVKALVLGLGSLIEKRRATEEIGRLNRRHEAILRSVAEGIAGVDREGRATFMNPAAERLLGWTQAEVLGRDMHDLVHSRHADGRLLAAEDCPIREALVTGRESRGEATFWCRDGTPLLVEYACLVLQENEPAMGCVVTFREASQGSLSRGAAVSRRSPNRVATSQTVPQVC